MLNKPAECLYWSMKNAELISRWAETWIMNAVSGTVTDLSKMPNYEP